MLQLERGRPSLSALMTLNPAGSIRSRLQLRASLLQTQFYSGQLLLLGPFLLATLPSKVSIQSITFDFRIEKTQFQS